MPFTIAVILRFEAANSVVFIISRIFFSQSGSFSAAARSCARSRSHSSLSDSAVFWHSHNSEARRRTSRRMRLYDHCRTPCASTDNCSARWMIDVNSGARRRSQSRMWECKRNRRPFSVNSADRISVFLSANRACCATDLTKHLYV